MFIQLGFILIIYLNFTKSQVQQSAQEAQIIVNNAKLSQQHQEQYTLQNNLLSNLSYGDYLKYNRSYDESAKNVNTRNENANYQITKEKVSQTIQLDKTSATNINIDDQLDWKILKKILLENSSENIIISPLSIKLILSILLEASGNISKTRSELINAISSTNTLETFSEIWSKTIKSLTEPNKYYDLNFGTKIYIDDEIKPAQKFASIVKSSYGAEIENLSFKNYTYSTSKINEWSSFVTQGHIKNIVQEEQLKNSIMLILNAIFFKGKWKYSFDPNESFVADFFFSPTKTVKSHYMTKRDYYNYMDSYKFNAKIIQIPYEGNRFHLTLLLPKAKGGLDQLIYDLTPAIFQKLEWGVDDETEVKLTLPKFKFQYELSLKETLQAIGINEIFNDNASLPLLNTGYERNFKVNDIYQKSGLQIDEIGSIAFSETVAAIENKFGGGIEDFTANRPFLFFIQDIQEDKILFAGKVVNPNNL